MHGGVGLLNVETMQAARLVEGERGLVPRFWDGKGGDKRATFSIEHGRWATAKIDMMSDCGMDTSQVVRKQRGERGRGEP